MTFENCKNEENFWTHFSDYTTTPGRPVQAAKYALIRCAGKLVKSYMTEVTQKFKDTSYQILETPFHSEFRWGGLWNPLDASFCPKWYVKDVGDASTPTG